MVTHCGNHGCTRRLVGNQMLVLNCSTYPCLCVPQVVAELLTWGRQEAVQLAALLDVLHDGGEDVTMTMTPCELPVGDDLWRLSDPFGICFHQFADVSGPNAVKDAARSSKAQEHEQQPQEKCKEHQEAQISDDP